MEKYITRDKLSDFTERMWEAGLRTDNDPKKNEITVWDENLHIVARLAVVDKRTYDSLVQSIIEGGK